jgi:hypothetical protein
LSSLGALSFGEFGYYMVLALPAERAPNEENEGKECWNNTIVIMFLLRGVLTVKKIHLYP